MKRLVVILTLTAVLFPGTAKARDNDFGLGIILGEPTGICLKYWVGSNSAIDGAVAWSFGNNDSLHLHADYLFHKFNLFKIEKGKLPLYYGIGIRVRAEGEARVGIRIPVGLNYIFEKAPLDIFIELAPLLDIIPDIDFRFNGAVGVRYYF